MLCKTARMWRARPSALLAADDPYIAYCIDEAGAWLLSQKGPPRYTAKQLGKTPINRDPGALRALAALGARVEV